jgi:phosphotransferase system enzyme I (PtsI)
MASDPLHGMLLVGLGFDELSMTPASIPPMKRIIRSLTYRQAAEVALRVFGCPTAKEVEQSLRQEMRARFPEYLAGDLFSSREGRLGFP